MITRIGASLVLLIALVAGPSPARAQSPASSSASTMAPSQQTLLSGQVEHGGYGGPLLKFGSIGGNPAVFVGGYGGWLIDHTIMLGGGGVALTNDIRADRAIELAHPSVGADPLYLAMGYGGGIVEVMLQPSALVHLSLQALVGAGAASYRRSYFDDGMWNDWEDPMKEYNDTFFVVEPSVNVELNMTEWFRVGAGASYRFISGIDRIPGHSNASLSGASGQLMFKFGAF